MFAYVMGSKPLEFLFGLIYSLVPIIACAIAPAPKMIAGILAVIIPILFSFKFIASGISDMNSTTFGMYFGLIVGFLFAYLMFKKRGWSFKTPD
ncbi:hypothetical protein GCM10023313_07480 [Mucilaginibacter defluvii]|uniref:Uncharacterized protein n=1 Tax=Mucilaginibacter defluvii TaxID=1196019 RepID=A0ABP9FM26_9SPHI